MYYRQFKVKTGINGYIVIHNLIIASIDDCQTPTYILVLSTHYSRVS